MNMKVGTINGKAIFENSDEWLSLLSAVSIENVPVPAGASKGIYHRLYERRRELQAIHREKLRQIAEQYGYKSIKAAKAAGWVEDRPEYIGGERIMLGSHLLVRNFEEAFSGTAWKSKGYKVRSGERPVGVGVGPYGNRYSVYVSSQMEAHVHTPQRRTRCTQCGQLSFDVWGGCCKDCHDNNKELANYIAENGLIPAVGRRLGK